MHWLVIILVLALVVGPVAYMLPSRKDKRLAALRLRARQLGLNISLSQLPKLDPLAEERVSAAGELKDPRFPCVAYTLSRELDRVPEIDSGFHLQRLPAQPTVPVNVWSEGWHLTTAGTQGGGADEAALNSLARALAPLTERLTEFLADAPADWFAVSADARCVACYWAEKAEAEGDELDVIRARLMTLRDLLGRQSLL